MRLLILILITTTTLKVFGQTKIKGEVRSKNDSTALPGVSVLETGTENGVNTDVDGKFTINCKSTNSTLAFSFIGFKTTPLKAAESYIIVYLETDEEQLNEKTRFGIYPEYTSIGFNSGVNYIPLGVNVRNSLPKLFGLRMLTTTEITYRTDLNKNEFIDIRFKRDRLINTNYLGQDLNLEVGYNKRQITRDGNSWNIEEFNVIPEYKFGELLFRLGYGRQSFNAIETLKSNQGLIFGFGKYFWSGSIVGTAKKWNNYWQTEFQFRKGFRKNDFEVGVKVETLARYREVDLLILYRIHY